MTDAPPPATPPSPPPQPRVGTASEARVNGRLPYRGWYAVVAVVAGALVGLLLRAAFFGEPGGAYAAMMASFIVFAPLGIAAVTVYVAERQGRRSLGYHAILAALANLLFVLGAFISLFEGLICVIVIGPFFCAVGALGGLLIGAICHRTNWPKQATFSFAALPLLLGGFEQHLEVPSRLGVVERSIHVEAPPAEIWHHILRADAIRPSEVAHGWVFRIGVPLPEAGVVEETADGLVRKVRMGRDVHFDQVVVRAEEGRRIEFKYRLYDDSFPAYALDDHVVVGGHYFDIPDTVYTLEPEGDGTRLTIRLGYRVTTQFNWYAEPIARALLGNLGEVLLGFYESRSERRDAKRRNRGQVTVS
jgi:hypothetical protein